MEDLGVGSTGANGRELRTDMVDRGVHRLAGLFEKVVEHRSS
jgi:hypothetical protein